MNNDKQTKIKELKPTGYRTLVQIVAFTRLTFITFPRIVLVHDQLEIRYVEMTKSEIRNAEINWFLV